MQLTPHASFSRTLGLEVKISAQSIQAAVIPARCSSEHVFNFEGVPVIFQDVVPLIEGLT